MSRLHSNHALPFLLCIYLLISILHAGTIFTTIDSQFRDQTIHCVNGQACAVLCQTIYGCRNTTIHCAAGQTCDITCNTDRSCYEAIIHAEHSSFFRLLDCATGGLTCIGTTIYFPPNNQGIPRSKLIGADTGLSAGAGSKYPLQFYAIHSWLDINITTGPAFIFGAHAGTMHCSTGYAASCPFASDGWHCASTGSCYVAHPTAAPTQPTRHPTTNTAAPTRSTSQPTQRPTLTTRSPTNPPTRVTVNPIPTSYPPTPLPTKRPSAPPTKRPTTRAPTTRTPTPNPTVRPTAMPTQAPSVSLPDCLQISNLNDDFNGHWRKSEVTSFAGRPAYAMSSYWLYYIALKTHGQWVIGSTLGSTDFDAFCVNEDLSQCSGTFSVRGNTGSYAIDEDCVVANECRTTTKEPTKKSSGNGGNDDGNDEGEDEAFIRMKGENVVVSGYLIPWYALAVIGVIILLFCCVCCMVFCKQRQRKKQNKYKNVKYKKKYQDNVQMI
eukprot:127464_1